MKRAFLLLVLVMTSYYEYEAYQVYKRLSPLVCLTHGFLSDIAHRVTPLMLDTNGQEPIRKPSKVRSEGERIYLVSEYTLHCFEKNGKYLGRITQPEEIRVADYMIDPVYGYLIVLGYEEDVYYYTLDGLLKYKTNFPADERGGRLKTIACYDNRIWAMKEIEETETGRIQHLVVEYDLLFTELNTHSLGYADTGRERPLFACPDPVFSVAPDTGELYIYSPAHTPQYLLRDTLYIRQHRPLAGMYATADISVYPVRVGGRFYLSSSLSVGEREYFYCYDQETNRCWELPDGITDDLHHNGQIRHFHPMDLAGEQYWYTCGRENDPVIYLVELKS